MKPCFKHAPCESLEQIHSGCFALMMATGIVALDAHWLRQHFFQSSKLPHPRQLW